MRFTLVILCLVWCSIPPAFAGFGRGARVFVTSLKALGTVVSSTKHLIEVQLDKFPDGPTITFDPQNVRAASPGDAPASPARASAPRPTIGIQPQPAARARTNFQAGDRVLVASINRFGTVLRGGRTPKVKLDAFPDAVPTTYEPTSLRPAPGVPVGPPVVTAAAAPVAEPPPAAPTTAAGGAPPSGRYVMQKISGSGQLIGLGTVQISGTSYSGGTVRGSLGLSGSGVTFSDGLPGLEGARLSPGRFLPAGPLTNFHPTIQVDFMTQTGFTDRVDLVLE